jgi:hypothetical protein
MRFMVKRATSIVVAGLVSCVLQACGGGNGTTLPVAPAATQRPAVAQAATRALASTTVASEAGLFPTSPYNQPLPANPRIAANSANIIAYYFANGFANMSADQPVTPAYPNGYDYNTPLYYAATTDPQVRIHCLSIPCPTLEGNVFRIPANAAPATGMDGLMAVLSPDGSSELDIWLGSVPGTFPFALPASQSATIPTIATGTSYPTNGTGFTSASGAPNSGGAALSLGLVRGEEIQNGTLNHAFFLRLPCSNGAAVFPTSNVTGTCPSSANALPLGSRIFLAMSDAQIAALTGLPTYMKPILLAMAHYGMFYGDSDGVGNLPILSLPSHLSYSQTTPAGTDPWIAIAAANGFGFQNDRIHIPFPQPNASWTQYLRVADPCVTAGTCPAPTPSPTPAATLQTAIMADAPTAYYQSDDSGGSVWHDASGNGNDGAIFGGAAYHVFQSSSTNPFSLGTDGTTAYLTGPSERNGSFSLVTFFDEVANAGQYDVVAASDGTSHSNVGFDVSLYPNPAQGLLVQVGYGSGYVELTDTTPLLPSHDTVIALTYDASTRIATFYKNGVAESQTTLPAPYAVGRRPITFGRAPTWSASFMFMHIGDTAYFAGTALSAQRIQAYSAFAF